MSVPGSSLSTLLAAATVVCGCAQGPTAPPSASNPTTPLVERAKFFGNPTRAGGRISPDGRWISWIAPRDGVLNVWVAPSTDLTQARPLTDEKVRPIRTTFWAPDSKTVLYLNDKGGNENDVLYGVNVASGAHRTYTPLEKTRAEVIAISREVKDRILVGLNERDARWHDVYSLDLASGKLTLIEQNDGYAGYVADERLTLRLAAKSRDDGGIDYFRMTADRVEPKPIAEVGLDDSQTTAPLGFTVDGKTLYWADSRGRDTAALFAQDVATGAMTLVAQDPRSDIDGGLFDPKTGRIQAYSVDYLRGEYVAIDAAIRADLEALKGEAGGEFTVVSRTDADDKWLVAIDRVTSPVSMWLYDRASKHLTELYVTRPELEGAPLVAMHSVEIKSRDGLTLISYLSLPKAADPTGNGRPSHPMPMVLYVHGGPWVRDSYGYNTVHQWLANRGYAVLSVNYRGSTGFGKKFISAGDLEWGRKMQDDLLDAVAWAERSGITTPGQVAIMGGSYGGYATLAAMTFTPTEFACGVDIVGPSNLFTLLQTIPPYWEAGRQQMYRRMGNPTTDAGRALLKERSPLNFADRIVRPLLIGQGANDPRVNERESDQIVNAMAAKNIPVAYVVFPDEGHGFARPENSIAFFAITENFLAKYLGGRAEPIGDTLRASTAQVRHGAELAPGLEKALAAK
jgi:dipeptidyl aminopeptidase/acylaminoacyl peptidase